MGVPEEGVSDNVGRVSGHDLIEQVGWVGERVGAVCWRQKASEELH